MSHPLTRGDRGTQVPPEAGIPDMKLTLDGFQGFKNWASNKEPEDQGDWGFLGPVNHA